MKSFKLIKNTASTDDRNFACPLIDEEIMETIVSIFDGIEDEDTEVCHRETYLNFIYIYICVLLIII